MKKKQLTKKQFKVFAIANALCAILWIIEAVQYICDYPVIRDIYARAETALIVKIIVAVGWTIIAVIWIIRYFRYDELSKNADA